jgi:opacity protein-like surface antigen
MKYAVLALAMLGATPACAEGFKGVRVEAHLGFEKPNLNKSSGNSNVVYVDALSSSAVYGGEIGYDAPVSESVTVGPYLAYDVGNANKCETSYPVTVCYSDGADLSVGVRAAMRGEKWRGYVGLGYDGYSTTLSSRYIGITLAAVSSSGNTISETKTRGGVGVTFGADYKLSRKVYAGVAMRVSQFGEFESTGYNLQRVQGHLLLGYAF